MPDSAAITKIAVNTGGGDAPGLNAVIRAVTLSARNQGWEVYGIRKGYRGLIDTTEILPLTKETVRGITHLGGSILGATNRGNPFSFPVQTKEGTKVQDISDTVVENFHKLGFNVLVCIGGDGSLRIAQKLINKGIPIVAIPKTIDNDLPGTVISFGFDTAVSVATEALDRLHSTAESHERVMVVELMGRHAGWIALHAGLSGSADVILIPEIPFNIDSVCKKIMEREQSGRHFSLVVCSEGAFQRGGSPYTKEPKQAGGDVLLGGIADYVAKEITLRTGKETRSLVLGHLQRGGSPTTFDRLLGLRFGSAAIRCILNGERNKMVALNPPFVTTIPIEEASSKIKLVPKDSDTILTARSLGISFGD